MYKEFITNPDSFQVVSLAKNQTNPVKKPISPFRLPIIALLRKKSPMRPVPPFVPSESLSSCLESKSLTPMRMKKSRMLSADNEPFSYLKTDLAANAVKSSTFNSVMQTQNKLKDIYKKCNEYYENTKESHDMLLENKVINLQPEEKIIYLLKSIFENRPCTVFFNYPQVVGVSKNKARVVEAKTHELINLTYRISESFSYPCIIDLLEQAGFTRNDSEFVLNIEGLIKSRVYHSLEDSQKANHFPGSSCLGRKDSMWKNIEKMSTLFKDNYSFCPSTYILPEDYRKFSQDREENPKDLWIFKPANAACGKGIKIITKSTTIKRCTGHIISKYIKSPHLINGYKYDLRVYVAVTNFNPLKVYLYNEGLVRFATVPYSSQKSSLKNKCVHLTNYSINKDSPTFINNTSVDEDGVGSKWSFRALKEYYRTVGVNAERIFAQIKAIVIKTLVSSEAYICSKMHKYACGFGSCYELYGFDVLLDRNLRAWLLEVNIFPSLSLTSPLDTRTKYMLMTDLFNLIGVSPYKRVEPGAKKEHFDGRSLFLNKNTSINDVVLNPYEIHILAEYEEEFYRKGHFERIFPVKETVEQYKEFFSTLHNNNLLLWKYLESDKSSLKKHLRRSPNCVFT
jgi:tubulin polyglutamylase TTLL4